MRGCPAYVFLVQARAATGVRFCLRALVLARASSVGIEVPGKRLSRKAL